MKAFIIIFVILLLGGIIWYLYSEGFFSSQEDRTKTKNEEFLTSVTLNDFSTLTAAQATALTALMGRLKISKEDLANCYVNKTPISRLLTTNGFIRPNSSRGMDEKIVVTVKTKKALSPSQTNAIAPVEPAIRTFNPSITNANFIRTVMGNQSIADKLSLLKKDAIISGDSRTLSMTLWQFNADVLMSVDPAKFKADDNIVIRAFNPYKATTLDERVALARRICSALEGKQTGATDPASGEYSCPSIHSMMDEEKDVTWATVKQVVRNSDARKAVPSDKLSERLPPPRLKNTASFTSTKAWADNYCNADGTTYAGKNRAHCRALIESYYGHCRLVTESKEGNYCK